jgi:host factor-I protein
MASKGRVNIQDQFLNQVRKERIKVRIELINGKEFEGSINSFDNFCIVLKDKKVLLVYKHAVSTITPLAGAEKIELF